jgi:hypothetical protein
MKVIKEYIKIVDADCDEIGGIMDDVNEKALNESSTEDLGKILKALKSREEMIEEMIIERHLSESYDKGFEEGKKSMLESMEENLF